MSIKNIENTSGLFTEYVLDIIFPDDNSQALMLYNSK
jgi:hypothetical protein